MATTFPHLLLQHAAQRPDAVALREKEYGIWQLRHGVDEHSLVLAAGEFRSVDEHECVFGQLYRTAQGAFSSCEGGENRVSAIPMPGVGTMCRPSR